MVMWNFGCRVVVGLDVVAAAAPTVYEKSLMDMYQGFANTCLLLGK